MSKFVLIGLLLFLGTTVLSQDFYSQDQTAATWNGTSTIYPMFAVHDFATAELEDRMRLANGDKCDVELLVTLEGILTETEQSKKGSEQLAINLKNRFIELMVMNPDKKLCLKESWCDMGICQLRFNLNKNRQQAKVVEKEVTAVPSTSEKFNNITNSLTTEATIAIQTTDSVPAETLISGIVILFCLMATLVY